MNHWNDVFERHGVTSTKSIVGAYFHFVSAALPYTYYKCGPSVLLRSIYLYILGWFHYLQSSFSIWPRQKDF